MRAASTERSRQTLEALFGELARARLLVPIRDPGTEPVETEDGYSIAVATAEDGSPPFLAFTDKEALSAWGGRTAYGEIDAPELCRLVVENDGAGLVINPSGPWGGQLSLPDVQLLAERAVLGLELSEGAEPQRARELAQEIASAVQPLLAEEEVIDLLPLEGELLRTVRHAGEEIYRRANG